MFHYDLGPLKYVLKLRDLFSYSLWNGKWSFLSDPGKPGVRSLGPDVCPSLSNTPCVDLTDVTLADEDTNSILTDNVNGQFQAMWQCM